MTTDTTATLEWHYPECTAPTATLVHSISIRNATIDVRVLLTKHDATTVSAHAYRVGEFGATATTIRTVCYGKTEEQLREFARLMATQLADLVAGNGGNEDA